MVSQDHAGDSKETRPKVGRQFERPLQAAAPEMMGEKEKRHFPVGYKQFHGSPTSDKATR